MHRGKHTTLMIVAVAGVLLQPVTHYVPHLELAFEVFAYLLVFAVFLSVFELRGERRIALACGVPAIVANIFSHALSGQPRVAAIVTYHLLAALFLGYAVAVILRGVFRGRRIGADQIVGAFTGYILTGLLCGNLYVVVSLLDPDAFQVSDGLASQLSGENTRRFLFNYFSFSTLTTVGYGDITPSAPAACALAWLEALFGQFYTAVFIGQLIGLKLAQSSVHEITQ